MTKRWLWARCNPAGDGAFPGMFLAVGDRATIVTFERLDPDAPHSPTNDDELPAVIPTAPVAEPTLPLPVQNANFRHSDMATPRRSKPPAAAAAAAADRRSEAPPSPQSPPEHEVILVDDRDSDDAIADAEAEQEEQEQSESDLVQMEDDDDENEKNGAEGTLSRDGAKRPRSALSDPGSPSSPTPRPKRRTPTPQKVAGVCRRTPIGVIRCRSSLRSVRTVLENTILTAVSTVVQAVIPTGTVTVIVLDKNTDRQGTG